MDQINCSLSNLRFHAIIAFVSFSKEKIYSYFKICDLIFWDENHMHIQSYWYSMGNAPRFLYGSVVIPDLESWLDPKECFTRYLLVWKHWSSIVKSLLNFFCYREGEQLWHFRHIMLIFGWVIFHHNLFPKKLIL